MAETELVVIQWIMSKKIAETISDLLFNVNHYSQKRAHVFLRNGIEASE